MRVSLTYTPFKWCAHQMWLKCLLTRRACARPLSFSLFFFAYPIQKDEKQRNMNTNLLRLFSSSYGSVSYSTFMWEVTIGTAEMKLKSEWERERCAMSKNTQFDTHLPFESNLLHDPKRVLSSKCVRAVWMLVNEWVCRLLHNFSRVKNIFQHFFFML